MTPPADDPSQEIAQLRAAIEALSARLHAIESRSSAEQIAAEVLRLNDAVRVSAAGRITPDAQPADFPALLLANADPLGTGTPS